MMNEMCSRVSNSFQCLLRNLWNLFYAHFQEFPSFPIKTFEWLTNSWQSFKILNFPLRIVKSWGRKFCENQRRRRWRISSWKLTDVSVFQVSRDFSSSSLRSLFSQPSALWGERIQQTEDASCSGGKITSCSSLWLLLRYNAYIPCVFWKWVKRCLWNHKWNHFYLIWIHHRGNSFSELFFTPTTELYSESSLSLMSVQGMCPLNRGKIVLKNNWTLCNKSVRFKRGAHF